MSIEPIIDFAIVGQPKSGTTALAEFLARHPQICISVPKEPTRFATDVFHESDTFYGARKYFECRSDKDYATAFSHCRPGQLRGDASTAYLYSKAAAANLKAANSELKIIAMLREPVSFMHSLHMQYVNETMEDETDFARALKKEPLRKLGEDIPFRARCPSYLFYRDRAMYREQLERYYALFPHESILVLTMEEFREDNEGHYRRVLAHLGAEPAQLHSFGVVHQSKAPRSRWVNHVLNTPAFKRTLFRVLGPRRYTGVSKSVAALTMREQPRSPLPPLLEGRLREEFSAEVDRVSELVGRDLGLVWGY